MSRAVLSLQAVLADLDTLRDLATRASSAQAPFHVALLTCFSVDIDAQLRRTLYVQLHESMLAVETVEQRIKLHQACAPDEQVRSFVDAVCKPGHVEYNHAVPFRWASAGYLYIFLIEGTAYVALLLQGPRHSVPGWNVCNGASRSRDELAQIDKLAEREGKEELLAIANDEKCYRLERRGARVAPLDFQKKALRLLHLDYIRLDEKPLFGTPVENQPDEVLISADWDPRCPYLSEKGFVVFDEQGGEMGIEYVQLMRFLLTTKLWDLLLCDGEIGLDGQPLRRPVGCFRMDRLGAAFLRNDKPVPAPDFVFVGHRLLQGEPLNDWLGEHPHARVWCPVTAHVLYRYIHEVWMSDYRIDFEQGGFKLTFGGEEIWLEDRVSVRYILYLLKHPHRPVSCGELYHATHKSKLSPERFFHQLDGPRTCFEDNDASRRTRQSLIDGPARKQYLQVLEALEKQCRETVEALANADRRGDRKQLRLLRARHQKLQSDGDGIRRELRNATFCGRARMFADETTKTCQSVTQQLRRGKAYCAGRHALLGEHLSQYMSFGSSCRYAPPASVVWR